MYRRLPFIALCTISLGGALDAQTKPLVTPKDLGTWESLGATRLSADGSWLAYGIARGNEDNELRVRAGTRDSTIIVPHGQSPVFSADSRWLAYLVGVPPKERDQLLKDKKPVHTSFGVRNLRTGETISIPDASAFSLNKSGGFVAVSKYTAEGKKTFDVLILELATGTRWSFSNVVEHAWSETRPMLAFTVMVDGGAGNGVQLFDGGTGAVRVLESSSNVYRAVSWRPKSDDLAVLRSSVQKEFTDTAHVLLSWANAGMANARPRMLDASTVPGFPAGTRIADYRRPTWSRDGQTLYFGVRQREPVADAPKKSDGKVSDVEIWHTNDIRLIPEQRSNEQRDLRSTMLTAWRMAEGRVVQLGSDPAESITVLEGDRIATEIDRKRNVWGQKFGRPDEDVWTVNVVTGARKQLLTKVRYVFPADPNGTRLPWFDGTDYWVVDVASGTRTNLTATVRASKAVDFVDRDDDHPVDVLPPIGAPAWTRDGSTLLVNTEYDVWALLVDGSAARRRTVGRGASSAESRAVHCFSGGTCRRPRKTRAALTVR
jgi:hypothetical protein